MDIPSQNSISKVVVDESVILGDSKPYLIYEGSEYEKVASDD